MATKKTTNSGADTIETAPFQGAETLKEGFEKAVKGYDHLMSFGKDNAEALIKSANAAGKGFESINSEVIAYTRKSVEESVAAAKAMMSARTLEHAFQLQTEFTKAAFETYVDQLAKFGDMALATTRNAVEPLQARVSAMADSVRAA